MAASNGGFVGDEPGCCYSELLFGNEISGLDDDCFGFSSSFSSSDHSNTFNTPKMLCFGDCAANGNNLELHKPPQKPEPACKASTPKSNKKRDGSRVESPGAPSGNQRSSKRHKGSNGNGNGGNVKVVKKQKLGERITALQQLVSPFGKTDTASVLHEALGYIRFLQDQVQALCSPYLQRSSEGPPGPKGVDGSSNEARKDDLRSRGLCLVPVELTVHVAESNGADLWTSAGLLDSVYSA
ncbi:transcription factor bHLH113-like isoform X2 [Andrographis paniculata]|uniref:transcription factor bHLH113-like isoform X2 n=1 Tax=Andrographis paniculata TaxID=175694 RepID=UPI0021E82368|nr:transcription factor bHLH113-like isoform X2 [Andrographis paniculata]